jgi:hypothetical protein
MNQKPIFLLYPREAISPNTSEPGGESWDPLLNTRRFFQENGIARECTFPIISWLGSDGRNKQLKIKLSVNLKLAKYINSQLKNNRIHIPMS